MELPLPETQSQTELTPSAVFNTPQLRVRRRKRFAIGTAAFLLVALLMACYIGVFGGNVRAVVPGKVYRSAQLTGNGYTAITARWVGNDLDSVLKSHNIKTVITLRGGSEKDAWYRDETAICAKDSVDYYNIGLSAVRPPPPEQMRRVLYAFDHATYPVLYHCSAGADRSGLIGALYLNVYENVPLDEAQQRQLTWRYGHLSWSRTRAMDNFLDLYRKTGNGKSLRDWITNTYPALYDQLPASEKSPPPDVHEWQPTSTHSASDQTAHPAVQ